MLSGPRYSADLPLPPLVRELVAPQSMAGRQCDYIDAVPGERLVDVGAQLLAFVGLEGAAVVSFVHRVEGQDDSFHHSKDLLVPGLAKSGKLTLEGVEDCVCGREQFLGEPGNSPAMQAQSGSRVPAASSWASSAMP